MELTLLLPLGFGVIIVNLPFSGAVDQMFDGFFIQDRATKLYDP